MLSKKLAVVDKTAVRCLRCVRKYLPAGSCSGALRLLCGSTERTLRRLREVRKALSCRLHRGESEGGCMKAKHWYDYLWVYAIIYFALGFFNILFAWLGMIDFLLPLFLAIFGGNKYFCNHLCGRGQLFSKLGTDLKCSRCKPTPRWMSSKWFRYGFLLFFLTMFGNMVFQTYLVAAGTSSLREAIKLFWTFRVPWGWAYTAGTVTDWVAQFSFGFYSLMLTSLLIGLIVMVLYKPRTWCAFCPMGTMTQGICKLKNKE